jgi:tetratricopeptide (TPR) repeat protein
MRQCGELPGMPKNARRRVPQSGTKPERWAYEQSAKFLLLKIKSNQRTEGTSSEEFFMTKEELAGLLMSGIAAQREESYEKSIKIFTEFISLESDPDNLCVAYGSRADSYIEIGEREKAIADMKKAADYGDEIILEALRDEFGINYTPQKPSSSNIKKDEFDDGVEYW